MTEDLDESNLLDYQGYVEDEINDFKEDDESIDDESSEVGWNSEDEKKHYTKNIDKLNETYLLHEEKQEEIDEEMVVKEEFDEEIVEKEEIDEEIVVKEEFDEEIDVKEEFDEEIDEEIVVKEEIDEKEEFDEELNKFDESNTIQETHNNYESFTLEEKPLVQEEINKEETKLPTKKCFWDFICDVINNFR